MSKGSDLHVEFNNKKRIRAWTMAILWHMGERDSSVFVLNALAHATSAH